MPTIIGTERRLIPGARTLSPQLLDDFWREVKRVMTEKEIPNDL